MAVMAFPKSILKQQGGQMLVEAVLLLVVGISITFMVTKFLQTKQYGQTLIAAPWGVVSGMIECGVWSGCGPDKHPASKARALSQKTED